MKSYTLRPDTFTLNFNLIFFRYGVQDYHAHDTVCEVEFGHAGEKR